MRYSIGLIVHEGVLSTEIGTVEEDEPIDPQMRILEHTARPTVISAVGDQLGLMDYCARATLAIQVGFSVHDGSRRDGSRWFSS
jgi:hypothetical protein